MHGAGAVAATGYKVANQAQAIRISTHLIVCRVQKSRDWSSVPRSTDVLINLAAEQNTDHWRKKCPPQEKSLFAYFFGVVKSMASVGTRPDGVAFDFGTYSAEVLKPSRTPPCSWYSLPPCKTRGIEGDYTLGNDDI